MKHLSLCIGLCLMFAGAAYAEEPKVDEAVKAINALTADPAKRAGFCEINKKIEALKEGEDSEALDAEMRAYLRKFGPEYENAWDIAEDIDAESPEGKALNEAFDALENSCK
jgi:hypothetical protein